MDGNHPVTDRFRDNGLRLGQRYGHNWRQGSRQDTYPFTPSQHHIHPSPSHFRTEGIQPQSLAAITLPPFNTIMSTDPLSTPFSPSPHRPRVSYLQPVRPHNREQQYVAEPFFCDHHRASSTLQLPSPRISSSRGPTTPVSRPSSRLSWDTEDASVSTHLPWQSQFQESFIDLTADSSSPLAMPPESRKRAASGSRLSDHGSASSSKRAKLEARQTEGELENIAELDLKEVNDDETFARIFEEQRVAEVKAQHEQAEKPVSFSSLQCIICMEPMTNITVTHCGHLFCHACLMEALIAGEQQSLDPGKGASKCPVCRKKVVRPKDNKPSMQVIPLEIKFLSRKSREEGKGKAAVAE